MLIEHVERDEEAGVMDSITQAALGATCGQAFFAHRLGRRAVRLAGGHWHTDVDNRHVREGRR